MKNTTAKLAQALGVSPRRIQQVVADLGLTPEKVGQGFIFNATEAGQIKANLKDAQVATVRRGWKILTSDYRPPIQGGEPVFDGTYPFTTPKVTLDVSDSECGNGGWHYCQDLATAFKIAGMWPDGRPSVAIKIVAGVDAIERGDKRRASALTFRREATQAEVKQAITDFSKVFGEQQSAMTSEQLAWREALGRPIKNHEAVEAGLKTALQARGLDWTLKRFGDARAAWAAWAARDARAAWAAWDARDARAARAARDARAALIVFYSAANKWTNDDPLLLTVGIRDAYQSGLAIAVPTAENELGWAMVD